MVTVNNSDYYNNIPAGRDLNNLPNNSNTGTTVGYQYDGLTEEDRFVQKVLQEHYDKVYKENFTGMINSYSGSIVVFLLNTNIDKNSLQIYKNLGFFL